jgi:hypothetical protein
VPLNVVLTCEAEMKIKLQGRRKDKILSVYPLRVSSLSRVPVTTIRLFAVGNERDDGSNENVIIEMQPEEWLTLRAATDNIFACEALRTFTNMYP